MGESIQMENGKYSVLMSVYHKEQPAFFRSSLNSMINQTIKPDEIILVKDGVLTQELEDVIEEFKNERAIKVIPLNENKGLGEALNIGMKYCSNEIIARMDTDDISKIDRCEKQLKMFSDNGMLSIVSSSIAEFENNINDVKTIKRLPTNHQDIVKYAKRRNPFNHPSVMFKRSAVEKAGGYKHFKFFEDYYLWVRIIMNGDLCANINEPLLYMRANSNMFSRRGGISYLMCIIRFKWHLKKINFFSFKDFLISASTQGIVAILPNKVRMLLYKRFLRTKSY
jgi:glycosyltransferase involved in cell wall biosynthesis